MHVRVSERVTQHTARSRVELGVIIRWVPRLLPVTADLIHTRSRRIRCGPGRGSAAGSLVAYVLCITDLDPIRTSCSRAVPHPERISMPDIDMDFDERRRGEMIRYTTEKIR